ncbi:MAG: hypothetical protein ACOCXD_01445 [Bacteroidota bacterium]
MIKLKNLFFLLCIGVVIFSCRTLRELRTLSKCEFRLYSIENIRLADVTITGKNGISDLDLRNTAKITKAFLMGEMPLHFIIMIEAMNPNIREAAINNLGYKIMLDDQEMANGLLGERIVVPPDSGNAIIPVVVNMDLFELAKNKSRGALLKLAFNLSDMGTEKSELTLLVKPTLMVGQKEIVYGKFIRLTRKY